MISEKQRLFIGKVASLSFMIFLFLMPIFTTIGAPNKFFYFSLAAVALLFVSDPPLFRRYVAELKKPLLVIAAFLLYFSLTVLWGEGGGTFTSTLKHSVYLLFFVIMINETLKQRGALVLHTLIFSSVFTLLILTLIFVDKSTLLTNRLQNGFFAAPSNVIDLGGYFAIGLISALVMVRETGKHWLYLPASLLFIGLLLTQSRGPLLALFASSFLLFAQYKHIHLRQILAVIASVLFIGLFCYCSGYGGEYYERLIDAYQQSFVRFGIWQHTLNLIEQHPWFGWGFDKTILFRNSLGAMVTTTHSVYLGTLLKGGVAGLLLLAMMSVTGLLCAWRRFHSAMTLEAMLYLFSLMFFITQGMFVIGSPGESWVLFWLPLAVVISRHGRRIPHPLVKQ